jgi:hypothetical protein
MENIWPFDDPPDVAVITLKQIISRQKPILFVSHDSDDGGWQFLDRGESRETDAAVVSLATILLIDSSIAALAKLPVGWIAWRQTVCDVWEKQKV